VLFEYLGHQSAVLSIFMSGNNWGHWCLWPVQSCLYFCIAWSSHTVK